MYEPKSLRVHTRFMHTHYTSSSGPSTKNRNREGVIQLAQRKKATCKRVKDERADRKVQREKRKRVSKVKIFRTKYEQFHPVLHEWNGQRAVGQQYLAESKVNKEVRRKPNMERPCYWRN